MTRVKSHTIMPKADHRVYIENANSTPLFVQWDEGSKFAKVVLASGTGRADTLIEHADLEAWAEAYLAKRREQSP